MKKTYYTGLAAGNIIKNRRLYIPNILAGAGLLAMFYIMETLSSDERLIFVPGGSYLTYILPMGSAVLMLLAFILLLYTNSFIMKQRGREFGLYNVLGMEKRHIARILWWESFISAAAVITGGILSGMLLYRLAALLICNILGIKSVLGIGFVRLRSVAFSAAYFALLYFAGFVINRVHVVKMKPVELLKIGSMGEREPKIKWVLLVAGTAALGSGYALALTAKSPIQAIEYFFVAVILVIIGTYCLFAAGTIAVLKLMKKNKRYYYRKNRMIAVSGMLYRMKQNAVGLASIAILATMVIVTLTATVSLYAGTDYTVDKHFPHNAYVNMSCGTLENIDGNTFVPAEELLPLAREAAESAGLEIAYSDTRSYLTVAFSVEDRRLEGDISHVESFDNTANFCFITAAEYEKITGIKLDLGENEVAVYSEQGNGIALPVSFEINGRVLHSACRLEDFPAGSDMYEIADFFGVVVSGDELMDFIDEYQLGCYGSHGSARVSNLVIDFSDEREAEKYYSEFYMSLYDLIKDYYDREYAGSYDWVSLNVNIKWQEREDLLGMYGTLFFLGILLSVVFLFATALIIYYKQISEGYEDTERFRIMQKVGMSPDEVKSAIRSQIVTVFFLPLVVAAVHTAFASPVLLKLLKILFLTNIRLYFGCMGATLAAFALIYVLIYSITAKVYYHIVK